MAVTDLRPSEAPALPPAPPSPAPAQAPPVLPLRRALWPLALALISAGWWEHIHFLARRASADMPEEAARMVVAMAPVSFALRALIAVFEAGAWRGFWAGLSRRLPFARYLAWVGLLSSLDLVAAWLSRFAVAAGGQAPGLLAPVAGIALARELWPEVSDGVWAGFGFLGLTTVVRIVLTGRVQARLLGIGPAGPTVAVAIAWLFLRTLLWWGADLMRGRSPLS